MRSLHSWDASCELRQHLDSVALETYIRDIVDRCRAWESRADSDNRRDRRPGPERALPIYMVDGTGGGRDDQPVVVVATSPTVPEQLESLLRRLLPTIVVPPPPPPPPTGTFGVGTIVTAAIGGGGAGHAACPASEDWNHCDGNFAAKFGNSG